MREIIIKEPIIPAPISNNKLLNQPFSIYEIKDKHILKIEIMNNIIYDFLK